MHYVRPSAEVKAYRERVLSGIAEAIQNKDFDAWARQSASALLRLKLYDEGKEQPRSLSGLDFEARRIKDTDIVEATFYNSRGKEIFSCDLNYEHFFDPEPQKMRTPMEARPVARAEPQIIYPKRYQRDEETAPPPKKLQAQHAPRSEAKIVPPRPHYARNNEPPLTQHRAAPAFLQEARPRPQDYYAEPLPPVDTPIYDAIMAMDGILTKTYGAVGRGILMTGSAAIQNPKQALVATAGLAAAATIATHLPQSSLNTGVDMPLTTAPISATLLPAEVVAETPNEVAALPDAAAVTNWYGLTDEQAEHLEVKDELDSITDPALRATLFNYMDHDHFREALNSNDKTLIQQRSWVIEAAAGAQRFANEHHTKMVRAGYDNAAEAFEGLVRFAEIESRFGTDLTNERNNKVFGLWHAEDRTWATLMFRYFDAEDLNMSRSAFNSLKATYARVGMDQLRENKDMKYLLRLRGDPDIGAQAMLHLQYENARTLVNAHPRHIAYEDFRANPGLHYVTHVLGAGRAGIIISKQDTNPNWKPNFSQEVMHDNQGIFYNMLRQPRNATGVLREMTKRYDASEQRIAHRTGGWQPEA